MALSVVGLVTLGSAIAASAFTLTWFSNKNYIEKDITGSVSGAYFAYGDGKSKETAFGINEPRHLYNLAWLQYMGTFNKDEDRDGEVDQQYYFEIDPNISVLNMSGWITPPIGTETYPFVGNFNGNDAVISGLTITSNGDNLTTKPDKVRTEGFTAPSIIGFFGVVGKYSDASLSYTLETNSIYNLYLDKITIQNSSSTKNVLAGLLAGYVNGYMSECGVYRGKFDFVSGTTNIADKFNNVSDYSLIGSYDSDSYAWKDIPGGGGQENDFGGSIDFASFDKRISYVIGSKESTRNQPYTKTGINGTVYPLNPKYYWNTEQSYTTTAGLGTGSYMPLNIDKSKLTTDTDGTVSYDSSSGEPTLQSNTGYITGYGTGSNTTTRIGHSSSPYTSSSGDKNYLYRSISSYATNILFDSSNYSFLYYDSNSQTTYRLADSDNSQTIGGKTTMNLQFNGYSDSSNIKVVGTDITFQKYDSVKKDFLETLSDGTTESQKNNGKINIHGMRIYSKDSKATIDTYGTIQASNAIINKETYSSYVLYQGGINFTLTRTGYVTMVVDTYTNTTGLINSTNKDGFFTLYGINRSSDKSTISSKTKINTIYKNGSTYEYNSTTTSGKTLAFDFSKLNSGTHLEGNALFYFEFPLNAGDYFLTEEKNATSPYILYLDIGANASSEDPGTEPTQIIEKIDFVLSSDNDYTGIVKINNSNYKASEVLFNINGTSSAQQFYFMRSSTGVVFYYFEGTGLSITIIGTVDNASEDEKAKWASG